MREKTELKQKAIVMRKEGNTYSEILEKIPVAKSTLSLWFHGVGLAKHQRQRLTQKKLEAGRRGGEAKRKLRVAYSNLIKEEARKSVGALSKRERWLIGVALYWAEGTKEKEYRPGIGAEFTNSDHKMIRFYLDWLAGSCDVNRNDIKFEIYIHKNKQLDVDLVRKFWSDSTGYSIEKFEKVYFKKHGIKGYRKNTGALYYGNVRVRVKASSNLNRRISGWFEALSK